MGQSSRSSSTLKKTFQTFKSFTPIQRTTSTTRMKYAFAILVIACAVATAKKCPSRGEIKGVFKQIDTNNNGRIDHKELGAALTAYAKSKNYTPTKADEMWVQVTAENADKNNDHQFNLKEFGVFAIAFDAVFM